MGKKEILIEEIERVPEPLLDEVLDFVLFLKAKSAKGRLEVTLMSEPVLKKDWLEPAEESAWQNL